MKFKIELEEKVVYRHTLTVEADSDVEVEYALDVLERDGMHPDDIEGYLSDNNVKILEFDKDESGEVEFEGTDLEEINKNEEKE
ncbi:hypothetical protein [Clostridium beijerinckii]|uniref:Uncharacterized protein n=1 Tax=Clostridium beijerinckii TaxID=1520 RepID=A0AAX0B4P5_CLOBE|nr:hypothetical protein [Clostridium beijerinckii]MBA8935823.1 hypothetical protein [Clostridium beijerinckii]NRT90052.1 hypothetical protein [Clostridium beijerinckii]NRU40217.1 hypothetical protein [Clostridium beijerinckii]NSA96505.1 hypothetical protein [Clostridium beijerinckii]NYC69582.1 hypothetical protein [Clostridium beijerinckii]